MDCKAWNPCSRHMYLWWLFMPHPHLGWLQGWLSSVGPRNKPLTSQPRHLRFKTHFRLSLFWLPFFTMDTGAQEVPESLEYPWRMLDSMQGGHLLERKGRCLGDAPCPQIIPCEHPLDSSSFFVWKTEPFSRIDHQLFRFSGSKLQNYPKPQLVASEMSLTWLSHVRAMKVLSSYHSLISCLLSRVHPASSLPCTLLPA